MGRLSARLARTGRRRAPFCQYHHFAGHGNQQECRLRSWHCRTEHFAGRHRALDWADVSSASIQRDALRAALDIDPRYEILLVLALGKPKETVVIEPLPPDGDIRYWRTPDGVHHVPKRSLDDLILNR